MKERDCTYAEEIRAIKDENPFVPSSEIVIRILRDHIVSHEIEPGTRLTQEQIADAMDMSRTPVREAFAELESEGFLAKDSHGYSVYIMTLEDYSMLLELRSNLEQLAVRLACSQMGGTVRRKLEHNISDSRKLLERAHDAWDIDFNIIDGPNAERLCGELCRMDREFHTTVVEASNNKYLINTYRHLSPMIDFFRRTVFLPKASINMVDRHEKIYKAVRDRDEELAENRMRRHLELTMPRAMGR